MRYLFCQGRGARLHGPVGEDNAGYLITKRERLGHDIPATTAPQRSKETA